MALVGHSYGGMVITGVAERVPERIGKLVYFDAILPEDGDSVVNLIGKAIDTMATAGGGGRAHPGEPECACRLATER